MRKVCYISGTRADFGLMKNTLLAIHQHVDLSLSVLVTGMHLLADYGETWREIKDSGLAIGATVPVDLTGGSGMEMAIALGIQITGFTQTLTDDRPDLLLLLGDRGEMLAGAIAALHLNIPIVHIHGGELSGTVDESIRHAISKLAHYHFTATEKSRERLIRMGEKPEHIFVTGAPGLDEILKMTLLDRNKLMNRFGMDSTRLFILVLFHPVVQQAKIAAKQIRAVLNAVINCEEQGLVIMPNADAGGSEIEKVIAMLSKSNDLVTAVHVGREAFLSLVSYADVMVGNSSSGIIEAASLGTSVVNIGDRQQCRERNANVIDVSPDETEISRAIREAQAMNVPRGRNVYGDGNASECIISELLNLSLNPDVLEKVNTY
ncbi:MAG: GDP/UDP-N,N'-diacetylbacillosamine 2-epimerase (hydrolyzing) [Gammaproteobacteria bacterium]|jgi:GDP/UDP-N,N'-diacetylbacillosamine 2-epimerase (hydrolysing)